MLTRIEAKVYHTLKAIRIPDIHVRIFCLKSTFCCPKIYEMATFKNIFVTDEIKFYVFEKENIQMI